MSSRIYYAGKILAVIAVALAAICLVLWFRYNIGDIYDELSGKSSRRAVEAYRKKMRVSEKALNGKMEEENGAEVTGVIDWRKN